MVMISCITRCLKINLVLAPRLAAPSAAPWFILSLVSFLVSPVFSKNSNANAVIAPHQNHAPSAAKAGAKISPFSHNFQIFLQLFSEKIQYCAATNYISPQSTPNFFTPAHPSTHSNNISTAFSEAFATFAARVNENTKRRATVPTGEATAIHTVPTGFSGVPPVGPATPEVATA